MSKPSFGTTLNPSDAWGLAPGLTHAYPFNEGSGSTLTDSSSANNATLAGGYTWDAAGIVFNGSTGVATIATVVRLATGFTTGPWSVAWRGTSAGTGIASTTSFGSSVDATRVVMFPTNYLRCVCATGDNPVYAVTDFSADDDYLLVADGSGGLSAYHNGSFVSTSTSLDTRNSIKGIGGDNGSNFLAGRLDYLYIWGARALNATDAANLHADPYEVYASGAGTPAGADALYHYREHVARGAA